MKLDKKDYISILTIFSLFILFLIIITKSEFLFGSTIDWQAQHIPFAEYFRTLFYDTKDIFPDFAMNLGMGQNIYNFAYYGLLSPFFLFSYALPFLDMAYYTIIMIVVTMFFNILLFYKLLKNNNFNRTTIIISTIILTLSTALTFHAHRHIMFISYMPFLILALHGIDNHFKNKSLNLVIIATFLMIMTSFYYSICGILTIIIYFMYKYLKETKKFKFKEWIIKIFKLKLSIFLAVSMSMVLLLPTLYTILNGRADAQDSINILETFIPVINIESLLYNPYGLGLISISLLSLIYFLFSKAKEKTFLSLTISILLIIPFFDLILNGGMYIYPKVFIPLLPLVVLLTGLFIEELITKKISLAALVAAISISFLIITIPSEYQKIILLELLATLLCIQIYLKKEWKFILVIPLTSFAFLISIVMSNTDTLVLKTDYNGKNYESEKYLINYITEEDKTFYRINNTADLYQNVNRNYNNIDYYKSTIYSSTENQNYVNFYFNELNSSMPHRNRAIISSTSSLATNIFMGNKYLIVKDDEYNTFGYEEVETKNNYSLYENQNVLPIGYASSNIITKDEYDNLTYPQTTEALLKNIVVDDYNSLSDFSSTIKELEFNEENIQEDVNIKYEDDKYILDVKNKLNLTYKLPEGYENNIIFIQFDMLLNQTCDKGDTIININGVSNKLTCKEWTYHNNNYEFNYQIINEDNLLNIEFESGKYEINDIKLFALDYNEINNLNEIVDPFIIDTTNTKGDIITGNISVKEDGYFTISVPYDQGFEITVDQKEIEYEKVNQGFIGFEITKGNHEIKIEYKAPFKNISLLISGIGCSVFIGLVVKDIYRKKRGKK